ncbi:unnamed protein product [Orchesella dallaii]|uniref:Calcineurin-binding protein cabin-1 n=1 Tax=Orchesella dallaii TaxID=48710 RepID=A0ABP1RBA6_9HEXA
MEEESANTNPRSGEEYYNKINNLLLSSTYFLHTVFQLKWKFETCTYWESTEKHGMQVWKRLAPQISKSIEGFHRNQIQKGCLEEWDFSTISVVLLNFGNQNGRFTIFKGVSSLVILAKELIDNSKQSLRREDYNRHLETYRESLKALQMDDELINQIINDMGVTSASAAWESAKTFLQNALSHVHGNEFEKAIKYYANAIVVPGLLPMHQSFVFEKLSECHLKLAQKLRLEEDPEWETVLEKAIDNANKALELNNLCWNAHNILAKCYRFNGKFKEALSHYEQLLDISPGQSQVKQEYNLSKVAAGITMEPEDVSKIFPQKTTQLQDEKIMKKKGENKSRGSGDCECPSSSSSSKCKVPNKKGLADTSLNTNISKVDVDVDLNAKVNTNSGVQLRINEANRELNYLTQLFNNKNNFNNTEHKEIINIMYKSGTDVYQTLALPPELYYKIKAVITKLYKSKFAENRVIGEEDMQIRYILIGMCLQGRVLSENLQNAMKLAKMGAEMYPQNPHYHGLVLDAYNELKDFEGGLRYMEEVWTKIPSHEGTAKLYYMEATYLDNVLGETDEDYGKRFVAYNKYIKALPNDHWRVPATYYRIAYYYMKLVSEEQSNEVKFIERQMVMARYVHHYFSRGQATEANVHPCFKSRLHSTHKPMVNEFLQSGALDKILKLKLTSQLEHLGIPQDDNSEIEVWERFAVDDSDGHPKQRIELAIRVVPKNAKSKSMLELDHGGCASQKKAPIFDVNRKKTKIKEGAKGLSPPLEGSSKSQLLPTETNLNDEETDSLPEGRQQKIIFKGQLPSHIAKVTAAMKVISEKTETLNALKREFFSRTKIETILRDEVEEKVTNEQLAVSENEIGKCNGIESVLDVLGEAQAQAFINKNLPIPMRQKNKDPLDRSRLVEKLGESSAESLSLMRKGSLEGEDSAVSIEGQAIDKLDLLLPEVPVNSEQVLHPVIETESSLQPPEFTALTDDNDHEPSPSPSNAAAVLMESLSATMNETASLTEVEVPDESHIELTVHEMKTLFSAPSVNETVANNESEETSTKVSPIAPLVKNILAMAEIAKNIESITKIKLKSSRNNHSYPEYNSPPPPEAAAALMKPTLSATMNGIASLTEANVPYESHNVPTVNEMQTLFSAPSVIEILANNASEESSETEVNNEFNSSHDPPLTNQLAVAFDSDNAADNDNIDKEPSSPPPPETAAVSELIPSSHESPAITEPASLTKVDVLVLTESHNVPTANEIPKMFSDPSNNENEASVITILASDNDVEISEDALSINELVSPSCNDSPPTATNVAMKSYDTPIVTEPNQTSTPISPTAPSHNQTLANDKKSTEILESAANYDFKSSQEAPPTNQLTIPSDSPAVNKPTSRLALTVNVNGIPVTSAHLKTAVIVCENPPSQRPKTLPINVKVIAEKTPAFMKPEGAEPKSRPDEPTALPLEETPPLTLKETTTTSPQAVQAQPQNDEVNNFSLQLPLYFMAIYCFAQGQPFLGICIVVYVLFILEHAN